jgi:predicted transcriptional regulator
MSNVLTIRLEPALARALEAEAKRSGSSRGELVRAAIRDKLARARPSALDALSDLDGIIDGPADLSTNKRHLATLGRRRRR